VGAALLTHNSRAILNLSANTQTASLEFVFVVAVADDESARRTKMQAPVLCPAL
jgi:hypothetical protein